MDQLELRVYPRNEIAEILSVNIHDSNNFARNVRDKLKKWGYGFDYTRSAVTILPKPETPAERLKEVLYRGLEINIQIDAVQFACFVAAFSDIEGFNTMPWPEKANQYNAYYGFCVCDKTLQNWYNHLKDLGISTVLKGSVAWRTWKVKGINHRAPVSKEEKETMDQFIQRRRELLAKYRKECVEAGMLPKDVNNRAGEKAYVDLWEEFGCCYYWCKNLTLSAFSSKGIDVHEVYELISEIRDGMASIR